MSTRATDTILIVFVGVMLVTLAFFVRTAETADSVAVLEADGITCGGCTADIEKALMAKEGIASTEVDVDAGLITISYDSGKARPEALAETLTRLGYGNSIRQVMTSGEYRMKTGKSATAGTVGCGGCCNWNGIWHGKGGR